MLGLDVKRGVATTLERVFHSSGNQFNKLDVLWTGRTAGIIFESNWQGGINAKVIFPSIDETAQIPKDVFNNLIGYALHELGHAWFTNNKAWDRARQNHGKFVSNLINGLEDPRIEQLVIDSGNAPNSRALFENLLNSVLKRDGYVEADDKRNIPFLLAVEGRRLNGYAVAVPSIIDQSPWKTHIVWALKRAQKAKDTLTITKIAIELFNRIREQEEQGQAEQEQDEQGEGQSGEGEGQPSEGEGGKGEPQPSSEDGNPSDKPSDEQGEGNGEGNPSDSDSDAEGEGEGDSEGEGDPSDKNGDGKSDADYVGGREVEPSDFIQGEVSKHSTSSDAVVNRPAYGKPIIETFNWR